MTTLLVLLTLVEVAIVLAVLVAYLVAIGRSLRRTAGLLGKVAFGVRAIETQTQMVGAQVPVLNERVAGVSEALGDLAALSGDADVRGDGARR
jgi:uncharacterized protein YoxC